MNIDRYDPLTDTKPFIGWKACEAKFYLDGLPITVQQALEYYKAGTTVFLPFALQRIQAFLEEQNNQAWLQGRKGYND